MAFDPTAVLGGGAFLGAETSIEYARPIYRSASGIGRAPRRTIQTSLSGRNEDGKDYISRILFVLISALIFISVISSFEVARVFINNYYSENLQEDEKAERRERIARKNSIKSILVFAVFAIFISFAVSVALLAVIKKNEENRST